MTDAGWQPDPHGRHEQRYYDGARWTEHVSDQGTQSTDPLQAGALAAPPRPPAARPIVQPGYRVPAETPPVIIVKHKSKWPWVLLGIFLFMVVGFVGCAALVGVGVNEAAKSISAEQESHAISQAQFDFIQIGTPKTAVLAGLGKEPTSTSSFESEAVGDVQISSDCIYYWESGKTFGNWYQFCFDAAGNLRSKSS